MDEYQMIRSALHAHADQALATVAMLLAHLGSKAEWTLDDSLDATEDLVRIAEQIGLPSAGDQTPEGLTFYSSAAAYLTRAS